VASATIGSMGHRLMLKIAGEIGTKSSRTRRRFLRVLSGNVRAALAKEGIRARVESRWSRLIVEADDLPGARTALEGVFGLHSVAEVATIGFEGLDDLVRQAEALFRDRVAGRTFAVRPKRSGSHPFDSLQVATQLGAALLPGAAGVDLGDPEVEVALEIVDREAYCVFDSRPGAGGLPLGTGGRAVALFSGGFDSPVAAWMAMRRGTELELMVCDLGGCGETDAALEVARDLVTRWAPGREPSARVVDLTAVVASIRTGVEPRLRQVALKRAMYRVGTILAKQTRADALVTGESLGQVSTQTLRNLAVAEEAAGVPVIRPLIGMDKEEIIARSRRIGTHAASERVQEHCHISTGRVETAARLGELLTAELGVDEAFIASAVGKARTIDLLDWSPGPAPEHVVHDVPPGAVLIDIREVEEGASVGSVRLPFSRMAEWAPGLDASRAYLFVCSGGTRSEIVAHELRRRGLTAFSMAGGVSGLRPSAA
jgi:thiamine biosynthesis protein ThiI